MGNLPENMSLGNIQTALGLRDSISRRAALGAMAALPAMTAGAPLAAQVVTPSPLAGDGVQDDTAALQAAIDRVHALGGGVVALPTGTFKIAGTIIGKAGVSIVGQGSLASRLLKVGRGHCLVWGTGVREADADIERVALEGFAVIGQASSGHLFWGRKATTAFALRDLYFEGGNSPVVLDSCYSLTMQNIQVRAAETGHNITINAVSHNVLLLQVASQVAKAGAGIAMTGCNGPIIIGGKLESNQQDQLVIGNGCRGVCVIGLYIEGIQPTATGRAGIAIDDVDTVAIIGGFFDATQEGGPMNTNGTGTFIKTRGVTCRLHCADYGFASIAPTQRHLEVGATAYACDVTVPLGASFVNGAPLRNIVRFSAAEETPLQVTHGTAQRVGHGAATVLRFGNRSSDLRSEWGDERSFTPKLNGHYSWVGCVELTAVPTGSRASVILFDAVAGTAIARIDRLLAGGSSGIDFVFREYVTAGRAYQIRLSYDDAAGQDRMTSGQAAANRLSIGRVT